MLAPADPAAAAAAAARLWRAADGAAAAPPEETLEALACLGAAAACCGGAGRAAGRAKGAIMMLDARCGLLRGVGQGPGRLTLVLRLLGALAASGALSGAEAQGEPEGAEGPAEWARPGGGDRGGAGIRMEGLGAGEAEQEEEIEEEEEEEEAVPRGRQAAANSKGQALETLMEAWLAVSLGGRWERAWGAGGRGPREGGPRSDAGEAGTGGRSG